MATVTHTERCGGSEAKKTNCVTKIDLQLQAPWMNFFLVRTNVLIRVGGWVGSRGGALAARLGPAHRVLLNNSAPPGGAGGGV